MSEYINLEEVGFKEIGYSTAVLLGLRSILTRFGRGAS